nr:FAD-dependent oxidoreductase [Streptomyces sp. Alain-F2R5]
MSETPDLVVVGAGPAGLAAAVTALAGGLSVALVDSGTAVGGQYWRHPPDHARRRSRPPTSTTDCASTGPCAGRCRRPAREGASTCARPTMSGP